MEKILTVRPTHSSDSPSPEAVVQDNAETEDSSVSFVEKYTGDIEFANEKLHRIESSFAGLFRITARITPKLYRSNRKSFDDLAVQADECIQTIRAQLVTFEAKIYSEYLETRPSWRFVLWVASFVSERARRMHNAIRHAREQKNALLSAAGHFRVMANEVEQKISDIRYAKVIQRVEEMLAEHPEYQKLLAKIPDLNEAIKYNHDNHFHNTAQGQEVRLARNKERMEQIREIVWNSALREFSEEDF